MMLKRDIGVAVLLGVLARVVSREPWEKRWGGGEVGRGGEMEEAEEMEGRWGGGEIEKSKRE